MIQNNLVKIDFANRYLDRMKKTAAEWGKLFQQVAGTNDAKLDLNNSQFGRLNTEALSSLLDGLILNPNIVALDLANNLFFTTFNDEQLSALFKVIFKTPIQWLNLSNTGMVSAGEGVFAILLGNIEKSSLKTLDLSDNNLQNLSEAELTLLFKLIQRSNIICLNLSNNNLVYLDDRKFDIICSYLRESKVTTLQLEGNKLPKNRINELQAIIKANCSRLDINDSSLKSQP